MRPVVYYPPFTNYLLEDIVRALIFALALAQTAGLILLARRRWAEDRRSATFFLIGAAVALGTFCSACVIALGRPATWPFFAGELLTEACILNGLYLVVGEARRGIWARRE